MSQIALVTSWLLCIALAYLSGSVPFGLLLARAIAGVDVRGVGSGNIGATNVVRAAGPKVGALVLVLDVVKGAAPVLLVRTALPHAPWLHAATALAAFAGHLFPIWLRWKGGKGVATALGVLGVLVPWAALGAVAVYGATFALLRVSSIGSLAAGVSAVAISTLTAPPPFQAMTAAIFLAILWTHRSNIARILRRSERKL